MFILVCYDIADDRRRNRLGRLLEGCGQRVQRSVFECRLRAPELRSLRARALEIADCGDDRVDFYSLCGKDIGAIAADGQDNAKPDAVFTLV